MQEKPQDEGALADWENEGGSVSGASRGGTEPEHARCLPSSMAQTTQAEAHVGQCVLTHGDVLRGLAKRGANLSVLQAIRGELQTASPPEAVGRQTGASAAGAGGGTAR